MATQFRPIYGSPATRVGSARRGSGRVWRRFGAAGAALLRMAPECCTTVPRAGPQRCNRKRFNRIARRMTLNRLRFNVCPGPTGVPAGAGRSVRRQTARTPTSASSNARRAGTGPAPPRGPRTRDARGGVSEAGVGAGPAPCAASGSRPARNCGACMSAYVQPLTVQRYPPCVAHTCAPPEDHSAPDAPPNPSRTPSSDPGPARPPTSMSSNAHRGSSDRAPSGKCESPPASGPPHSGRPAAPLRGVSAAT